MQNNGTIGTAANEPPSDSLSQFTAWWRKIVPKAQFAPERNFEQLAARKFLEEFRSFWTTSRGKQFDLFLEPARIGLDALLQRGFRDALAWLESLKETFPTLVLEKTQSWIRNYSDGLPRSGYRFDHELREITAQSPKDAAGNRCVQIPDAFRNDLWLSRLIEKIRSNIDVPGYYSPWFVLGIGLSRGNSTQHSSQRRVFLAPPQGAPWQGTHFRIAPFATVAHEIPRYMRDSVYSALAQHGTNEEDVRVLRIDKDVNHVFREAAFEVWEDAVRAQDASLAAFNDALARSPGVPLRILELLLSPVQDGAVPPEQFHEITGSWLGYVLEMAAASLSRREIADAEQCHTWLRDQLGNDLFQIWRDLQQPGKIPNAVGAGVAQAVLVVLVEELLDRLNNAYVELRPKPQSRQMVVSWLGTEAELPPIAALILEGLGGSDDEQEVPTRSLRTLVQGLPAIDSWLEMKPKQRNNVTRVRGPRFYNRVKVVPY